jgi:hypothetical protein
MIATRSVTPALLPSPTQGVWQIGPVPLRAYALRLLLGIVVAMTITERRLRSRGVPPGVGLDVAGHDRSAPPAQWRRGPTAATILLRRCDEGCMMTASTTNSEVPAAGARSARRDRDQRAGLTFYYLLHGLPGAGGPAPSGGAGRGAVWLPCRRQQW